MDSEKMVPDASRTIIVVIDGQRATYPLEQWKRAINYFLDGMWSQPSSTANGAIIFYGVVLSLSERGYHIQQPEGSDIPRPPFRREAIHAVSCERHNVELGLAKFVRNPNIKMFVIEFAPLRLMLWKGKEKSELSRAVVDRTF